MHNSVLPAATLIMLLAVLGLAGAQLVGLKQEAVPCPAQDELKSFLSEKARGIKQWNAFKEIHSFEVGEYQTKVGDYAINFNQGYVNCVIDGQFRYFKCDRRDPIFSISSEHPGGGVLEARELIIDPANFRVVGRIMCTRPK